jgi:hypothetical protein
MTKTKKLLVLLALGLGACRADNRSSIEILGRAAPSSTTDCTFAPGGQIDGNPAVLDVATTYNGFLRYRIPLYVNNLLADPTVVNNATVTSAKAWRPDVARVRVNPSSHVNDVNPSPALLAFQAENTIPMQGQVIDVGGKSVQIVDVVSHQLGQAIQALVTPGQVQRMVLGISLQGHTLDGQYLDSGEWYYPVDVCNGCLSCTACTGTTPICAAPAVPASGCGGPGQDQPTVCVAPGG